MSKSTFNLQAAHPSWHDCILMALQEMDSTYLEHLQSTQNWLPGSDKIFSAFSLPLSKVNYLLLGESPYPRSASANGYAFWDAAVGDLWDPKGMNKKVNRATSLRNFIKMLFVAEGLLQPSACGQEVIASLDKTDLIQTNKELFTQLLDQGFLLLNATLVLHPEAKSTQVRKDARAWQPFLKRVIDFILEQRPQVEFILFGKIAQVIEKLLPDTEIKKVCVEHPYNHTFINNKEVLHFFEPFHLLRA